MCSKDKSNPAVCCCICEFPLLSLCEKHLAEHPTDSEAFVHFHLPLNASQIITTSEIKAKYDTWFYKLHRAGTLLKANNEELRQFEEQIEAAKQEICYILETEVAQAKQKVASLREALNVQLETAIRDTNTHAMEHWTPEPGSISSLIWNFGSDNYSSLKLFRLWVGNQRVNQLLQIYIESALQSLSHFNQYCSSSPDQIFEQTQLELSELKHQNDELRTENMQLRQTNQELQASCKQLSETIEVLKSSIAVQIEPLDKEKHKKASLANTNTNQICEKTKAIKIEHKELEIATQETPSQYAQNAESLRKEWDLIRNKTVSYRRAANVGVALGEVLGLHLSKFSEAESIVDESLRAVAARIPTSEVALMLWNVKAALLFHTDRNLDCEVACMEIIETFATADIGADLYWTTYYYLTFALCNRLKISKAENAMKNRRVRYFRKENPLAYLLQLCIRGRISLENDSNTDAEICFKEATQVAAKCAPTSIYAAMNFFYLGWLYVTTDRTAEGIAELQKADSIFSVHFPGSIYSALTLSWLAESFQQSNQRKEACAKYIQAHTIFTRYHPYSISTADNLSSLAVLYRDMGQLEEAERTYEQTRTLYGVRFSTSNDAAMNLHNFAVLYEEMGKCEEAIACAASAFDIWSRNNSENAKNYAFPLVERLKLSKGWV